MIHFDNDWYLSQYSDVKFAYESGKLKNIYEHYTKYGMKEGRLPVAPDYNNERIFAYGSFGSNNVGDEAILEGIKRLYPKCTQFISNKARCGPWAFAQRAIQDPKFFQKDDYLIIGGGGLLYSRSVVTLMADLATAAVRNGAIIDILRLGCEAADVSYFDEIKRLFSLARVITVRSSISKKLIEEITGLECEVEYDFAFLLKPEIVLKKRIIKKDITIGIVTATSDDHVIKNISEFIKKHTRNYKHEIKFIHIPHSRSYFNLDNNDRLNSEKIWTLSNMHNANNIDALQLLEYDDNPISVLEKYKRLDGVITQRYHGLIFSNISDIPAMVLGNNNTKTGGFMSDHASAILSEASIHTITDDFQKFIETVINVKNSRIKSGQAILES